MQGETFDFGSYSINSLLFQDQSKSLSSFGSLQLENNRIKNELDQVTIEVVTLRSANENLFRLEQTLSKHQSRMDEIISEKVASREAEIQASTNETIKIYKERCVSLPFLLILEIIFVGNSDPPLSV